MRSTTLGSAHCITPAQQNGHSGHFVATVGDSLNTNGMMACAAPLLIRPSNMTAQRVVRHAHAGPPSSGVGMDGQLEALPGRRHRRRRVRVRLRLRKPRPVVPQLPLEFACPAPEMDPVEAPTGVHGASPGRRAAGSTSGASVPVGLLVRADPVFVTELTAQRIGVQT